MEKNYVNLFCQMTKFCKDTKNEVNQKYFQGKKEAYDEILLLLLKNTNNLENKLNINYMIMNINEKLEKLNNEKDEEEIKSIFDINNIKIESKKKSNNNNINNINENNLNYIKSELFLPKNKKK